MADRIVARERSVSSSRDVDVAASASPVGKAALTDRLAGGDDLLGITPDRGSVLIAALRTIESSPSEATVNREATAGFVTFGSTKLGAGPGSTLSFLYLNFMKTCLGREPGAHGWFDGNLGFARDVIGEHAYATALAMGNAAEAVAARRTSFAPREVLASQPLHRKTTAAPVSISAARAKVEEMLDEKTFNPDRRSGAADALRAATFGKPAVDTAIELMHLFRTIMTEPAGSNQQLAANLDRLLALITTASAKGVVSMSTVRKLRAWAAGYKRQYPVMSAEQRERNIQLVRDQKETELAKATTFRDQLRELKVSLDRRNGYTVNGAFGMYAYRAQTLVEHRLPELEAAIARGDVAAIERVFQADEVPWVIAHGGPLWLAETLAKTHEDGLETLEVMDDLVGLTPIGPFTKVIFSSCIEYIKYRSRQETGYEALTNIAIKAASPSLDRIVGGPAIRDAFLAGVRGALESLMKDVVKIAASDRPAAEKWQLIEQAGQKAIFAGFVSVITGRLKLLASNMDEGARRALVESILDAAGKLGIERPLKPELDRFVPS